MKPVSAFHFHSEFSIQDSIIRIDQLDAVIKGYGIKDIALTDHGTVDGAIQFYQTVKKAGANPILGCEFYVVDDLADRSDKRRWHAVLLAKNSNGFSSIMRALTKANTEGFYIRPRIDWKYLLSEIQDCVYLTACTEGVLAHPNMGDLVPQIMDKFGDDFYWEAPMLKNYLPQREYSQLLRDMQELMGGKIIFTGDVHYIKPEDWQAREVIRRLSFNQKMLPNEPAPADMADLHLKTYEEMVVCAQELGFKNSELMMAEIWDEVAAKCTWEFKAGKVSVPLAYEEAREDPGAYLREQCFNVIENVESLGTEEVVERCEYELGEIIKLGFAEYFLLVQEMVLWAKHNGCMVGPGRGSVGGSLVAYLLGITDVNPLEYGLMFERFISPERHDLPDIDLDFEDAERDRVIQHMRDKYGERSVTAVSTFSTMKGRGVVRDVSRVFSVPLVEVDQIAKQILVRSGGDARADFSVEDTVALFENAKEFNKKYPYVIQICKKIEGNIKTKGVHAAGLVVDVEDLYSGHKCVVVKTKSGDLAVNWDKHDIEFAGVMKIDALGLKTLNILRLAKEEIKRRHNVVADYSTLPLDDPKVLEAFTKADTAGIFQFGSAGMIQYIRNFKPKNFNELVQVNSLFRPGTLRSGMASKFILYKDGVEKPTYINAQMKELLGETYGIVLYQEQMMRILNKLSGIPWRTVDVIRKVVSKSEGQDKFETFRKDWLAGVQKLGTMSVADAQKVFTLMKFFGCLTGDTKIYRCASNQHKDSEMTIEEAYKYQDNYNFKRRGLKILSMHDDGFVRYNTIKRVWKTGMKPVYLIRTAGNKTVRASAEHHFMVGGEWKTVSEISVGDRIRVSDLKLPKKLHGEGYGSGSFGQTCPRFRKGEGPTNEEKARREHLVDQYGGRCQVCGSGSFPEMHHINGDTTDNSEDNTMLLCRKHHRAYTDSALFRRYRVGYFTQDEEIVEKKFIGERETYDMEMEEEPANFIANNFVSHNSYGFNKSHSVEYTMLGYWTMWLKVYYPTEFFHATLVRASDDDIVPLLSDAQRHGMKIKSPDINCSGYSWTIEDTGVLRGGFDIIKGISTNSALELVKAREAHGGKFEDIFDFAANIPRRLINIGKIRVLLRSKALDSIISEEDRKKLVLHLETKKKFPTSEKQYKDIDASAYVETDVLAYEMPEEYLTQNKALVELLSRHFRVKKLSYLSGRENEAIPEYSYHIGKYDEIKFGFRQKVEQSHGTGSDVDVKGYASDLGGCYGIFRDDTSLTYSTVTGKLYHSELKGEIEEIASRMIIMRANKPAKTSNIFMDRFQFMDYIKKGDLGMLDYRGIVPYVDTRREAINLAADIQKCELCPAYKICKRPTPFSAGIFQTMIIGEAPGADEDASGLPFVGKAGRTLWGSLDKHGLSRDLFWVTNVLKCRPKDNKIVDLRVPAFCSAQWLRKEIAVQKPRLILSLGKTALHWVTGDNKASIMDRNGTAEWSESLGAWLVYCIHPSMVSYDASHRAELDAAVKVFSDMFLRIIPVE